MSLPASLGPWKITHSTHTQRVRRLLSFFADTRTRLEPVQLSTVMSDFKEFSAAGSRSYRDTSGTAGYGMGSEKSSQQLDVRLAPDES